MAKPYSPKEIAYLIENYLEPHKIIGRHLGRSAAGIKQMLIRLDNDGRIIRPVVVKPERAWYRWEVVRR